MINLEKKTYKIQRLVKFVDEFLAATPTSIRVPYSTTGSETASQDPGNTTRAHNRGGLEFELATKRVPVRSLEREATASLSRAQCQLLAD